MPAGLGSHPAFSMISRSMYSRAFRFSSSHAPSPALLLGDLLRTRSPGEPFFSLESNSQVAGCVGPGKKLSPFPTFIWLFFIRRRSRMDRRGLATKAAYSSVRLARGDPKPGRSSGRQSATQNRSLAVAVRFGLFPGASSWASKHRKLRFTPARHRGRPLKSFAGSSKAARTL